MYLAEFRHSRPTSVDIDGNQPFCIRFDHDNGDEDDDD